MESKEQQFAHFVAQHKSTIYTVCYMFSKDNDEVADLFQEVLIHLWQGFDGFRDQSSPRTWVYRVALNTCISLNNRKKRKAHARLSTDINLFEDNDADTQQVQRLYERIRRLGPYDRALIMLWLENMSYEEIAAVMGITVKNVSVRLYRIKEALKKMSDN